MSEIAEFLRARYAERRALAEAAAECARTGDWRYEPGDDYVSAVQTFPGDVPARRELWTRLVTEAGSYVGDHLDEEIGTHIAANDPAFVIADCDTKLALVDEHPEVNDGDCGTCVQGSWGYPTHGGSTPTTFPCRTLRLLAQPFAGHPDHKGEEWTP